MASFAFLSFAPVTALAAGGGAQGQVAAQLPLISLVPFVGLLLTIALCPLLAHDWWHSNRNKAIVAAVFALPILIYMPVGFGAVGIELLADKLHEYLSFIVLLGALFVISGGVFIGGSLRGTPRVNTAFLLLGTLLASFIGTTGASMLLIRPLLRANAHRPTKTHLVVMFIFTVSNCGGLLTPLGDPPLFLGFLAGVPFGWTFHLWLEWAIVNLALLVIFHTWDTWRFRAELRAGTQHAPPLKHLAASGAKPAPPLVVHGAHNFLLLIGVVATIYCAGSGVGFGGQPWPIGLQELVMLLLTAASYWTTPRHLRAENKFDFYPLVEVAVLFVGIFIAMTPALLVLNGHGPQLGLSKPWHFFWATGVLSGFLDNAPTYLTFASVAAGLQNIAPTGRYLADYLALPPVAGAEAILAAISCGSVFMGAISYIGNGPNFMVKSIAEESGVAMPSFFGYLAYSGAILLPLFVVITFVFFR